MRAEEEGQPEAERNRELLERIEGLQLSHVQFNPVHFQVTHFRPYKQSSSLSIGASLAHQSRRVEADEFGMDISSDAAAMGAAGGGSPRMAGATEQSPYPMALKASSPRMPPADAE